MQSKSVCYPCCQVKAVSQTTGTIKESKARHGEGEQVLMCIQSKPPCHHMRLAYNTPNMDL